MRNSKQNWFSTLNEALESENLVHMWPLGLNIEYGESAGTTFDDATKFGHYITIYRSSTGNYERPVHYKR